MNTFEIPMRSKFFQQHVDHVTRIIHTFDAQDYKVGDCVHLIETDMKEEKPTGRKLVGFIDRIYEGLAFQEVDQADIDVTWCRLDKIDVLPLITHP